MLLTTARIFYAALFAIATTSCSSTSTLSMVPAAVVGSNGTTQDLPTMTTLRMRASTPDGTVPAVYSSEKDGVLVLLSPEKDTDLSESGPIWFNLVVSNKSGKTLSLSVESIDVEIHSYANEVEHVTILNADELEKVRKSEALKGQVFGWATLVAGTVALDNIGGDAMTYATQGTQFMLEANSADSEITSALVQKYQNSVLTSLELASGQDHGGLFQVKAKNSLHASDTIIIKVETLDSTHQFAFNMLPTG